MKLSKLLQNTFPDINDIEIGSIHYKAQDVKKGGLFVAISGFKTDGHNFVKTAFGNGALAVVVQKKIGGKGVIIEVENSRRALSNIASQFYDSPSEKLVVIGITGTNGKTTTSYLIESILNKAGFNVGVIGTINYRYSDKSFKNPGTTPESLELMQILDEMNKNNVTHVIMEVSSHAIDLFRVADCYFDVCIFTNLTQDHLDYHKDINSYWECKQSLFTNQLFLGPKSSKAKAVINCSNDKGKELFDKLKNSKIAVSIDEKSDADIKINNLIYDLNGISGFIRTPSGELECKSHLVGKHNAENILCAAGVAFALNIPIEKICLGIESNLSVPGRLQRVSNNIGRFIYVDYAHTPDALENVLSALKKLSRKRIICVFGCGGDRDKTKRPIMGEIAERLSDFLFITSDNPRSEDPLDIINQILKGFKNSKSYTVEVDRRKAIKMSIMASKENDIILIAGKGHENYQIIGNNTYDFDDVKETEDILNEIF